MSDDFDNNDLPEWLQDDDDSNTGADDAFDWLDEPAGESDASGGDEIELPDDDAFDWLDAVEPAEPDTPPDWLEDATDEEAQPAMELPSFEDLGGAADDWSLEDVESELPDDLFGELENSDADVDLPDDLFAGLGASLGQSAAASDQPADAADDEGEKLGTGELSNWFLDQEDSGSGTPDWLSDVGSPTRKGDTDLLNELLSETPLPGRDEEEFINAALDDDDTLTLDAAMTAAESGAADDFADMFSDLDLPDDDSLPQGTEAAGGAAVDWFADVDEPRSDTDTGSLDWLQDIDELDMPEAPTASPPAAASISVQSDDDFFPDEGLETADLSSLDEDEDEVTFKKKSTAALQDVETYLSELEDVPLPDTKELSQFHRDVGFDELFTDPAFSDIDRPTERPTASGGGLELAEESDLLAQLGATVGEVTATSIVRQKADRPLEELPDRLKKLHDRGDQLPDVQRQKKGDTGALNRLLAGVEDVLPPAPIAPQPISARTSVALTDAQQKNVEILKELAGAGVQDGETARASAIDLTYDTPYMQDEDLLAEGEAAAEEIKPVKVKRRRRLNLDRVLMTAVLALLVIAPFAFDGLNLGNLPASSFAANSPQLAAFDQVDNLSPGAVVLVAAEYSPTGAGELDDLTRTILRHVFLSGAHPVVVSTDPVGLLHANNVITDLAQDTSLLAALGRQTPLQPNAHYYVPHYIVGSAVGLRSFSQDTAALVQTDLFGDPIDLDVNSLADFQLIIVINERADGLRQWAEQVAPLTNTPIIAVSSMSASPLVEPYYAAGQSGLAGIDGLLVGFRDAYTYSAMLDALVASGQRPRTGVEFIEPTPRRIEPIAIETQESVTPEGQPPEEALLSGVVTSTQSVNVRSGPGTNFSAVAAAAPGEVVEVIGPSDDGQWMNIRNASGVEGWISATLLRIEPISITVTVPVDLVETAQATVAVPTEVAPTEVPPTNAPTEVPPTAAPTEAAATAAPTLAPPTEIVGATPTLAPVAIGVVISSQNVNIRQGSDTTFPVVDVVPPATRLDVLGQNPDGTWVNVRTPNDIEGWVSASLISLEPLDGGGASLSSGRFAKRAVVRGEVVKLQATPPPASADDGSATPDDTEAKATATPEPAQADVVAATPFAPSFAEYANERSYAMTLGIIGAAAIIGLGAFVNIIRGLLRRNRS